MNLVYIKKKEDHFLDEQERILYAIRVTLREAGADGCRFFVL